MSSTVGGLRAGGIIVVYRMVGMEEQMIPQMRASVQMIPLASRHGMPKKKQNFSTIELHTSGRTRRSGVEQRNELAPLHAYSQEQNKASYRLTSTLIGAETGIKIIAAVHSQCPMWVKSGQTITG
jgi:hypothetical protein